MAVMVLDRFSGSNPEGWIFRAERYFTYLGFSEKDWLPLPYFYLNGEALTWFTRMHHTKQFRDWQHFKEKLMLYFQDLTSASSLGLTNLQPISQPASHGRISCNPENSEALHVVDRMSTGVFTKTVEDNFPESLNDKVFDEIPQSHETSRLFRIANNDTLLVPPVTADFSISSKIEQFSFTEDSSEESREISDSTVISYEMNSAQDGGQLEEALVSAQSCLVSNDEMDLKQHLLPVETNCEHILEGVFKTIFCFHNDFDIHLNKWCDTGQRLTTSKSSVALFRIIMIDIYMYVKICWMDIGRGLFHVFSRQGNIDNVKEVCEGMVNVGFSKGAIELLIFVKAHGSRSKRVIMAVSIIIDCQDQTLKASLAKYHIPEPSRGIGRIMDVISLKQMDAFPRDPQVVSGLCQELANQMKAAATDSEILSNEVAKLVAEVSMVADTLKMNHTLVFHESSKEFFSSMIGTVMVIGIWDPGISSTVKILTGHIGTNKVKVLLRSTSTSCLFAYSNPRTKVWDLGRKWCIVSFTFSFVAASALVISTSSTHLSTTERDTHSMALTVRETILPWRKGLLVLLFSLSGANLIRHLPMPMTIPVKCVLKFTTDTFGGYLIDFYFQAMPRARSYNGGDHTLFVGSSAICASYAFPCPSISRADNTLLIDEYFKVNHEVLVAKFQHSSVSHHDFSSVLDCSVFTVIALDLLSIFSTLIEVKQPLPSWIILVTCDKLHQLMTAIPVGSSRFPFDPGGHQHFHFNYKGKKSMMRFTTKISVVLYSNLEDKVLIEEKSIVMNGPGPILAKQPNIKLSNYVWDPG